MDCFYINLDSAIDRKLLIEENFEVHKVDGWSLSRFSALDVNFVNVHNIKGRIRDAEKACFLSHKFVIEQHLESKSPLLIMEDDAMIGGKTCDALSRTIKFINKIDWDIIFTDIVITQPEKMIELIRMREKLLIDNQITLLNLVNFSFAGATSYVINPKSINKIFGLLDKIGDLNIPYDLYLRKLIREKKLNGYLTFPFLTTLSSVAELSQIQPNRTLSTDLVLNAFRRMIWLERKISDIQPFIQKIDEEICDEESKFFGIIIAACLSKKFVHK